MTILSKAKNPCHAQCGKMKTFLLFRFYVKAIVENSPKTPIKSVRWKNTSISTLCHMTDPSGTYFFWKRFPFQLQKRLRVWSRVVCRAGEAVPFTKIHSLKFTSFHAALLRKKRLLSLTLSTLDYSNFLIVNFLLLLQTLMRSAIT